MTISTRRTDQGALELTTIVKGQLVWRQYFDYSKADALRLFRAYIKEIAA
jgi:hypothetical protein